MALALALPRSSAIKSNFYQRYVNFSTPPETIVRCNESDVFAESAKVEIEVAKISNKYVHLLFSYNNKYWQRESENNFHLKADQDQPEEDTSKWTCTLFEPISRDGGLISLRHVQTGWTVRTGGEYETNPTSEVIINAESTDSKGRDLFTIVDWDTLVKLPKNVAFKGYNDKYLSSKFIDDFHFLQFQGDDLNDVANCHEVIMHQDGKISIKSKRWGLYWRRNPDYSWILANGEDDSGSDTLFWPVKVENNTIVLRNEGNLLFCKALTADGKTNCFSAGVETIVNYTKLKVEENVLEREIYEVVYNMDYARILDETPYLVGKGHATNSTDQPSSLTITVKYEDSKSYSFTNSSSITAGVTCSIEAGIPFIEKAKIEISISYNSTLEWNTTTEETISDEASYTVQVPPFTKVTVDYVATKGTCNVPFTYNQKDKSSTDGSYNTTTNNVGIFKGVNSYNFQFTNVQESAL